METETLLKTFVINDIIIFLRQINISETTLQNLLHHIFSEKSPKSIKRKKEWHSPSDSPIVL